MYMPNAFDSGQAAEARVHEEDSEGEDGQGNGVDEQQPPPLARRGPGVHGRGAEAAHRVAFEHVGDHGGAAVVSEDEESNDDDDFVEIVEVPAGGRRIQLQQQLQGRGAEGGRQGAQEEADGGGDGGRRVRRRLDPDLQQVGACGAAGA